MPIDILLTGATGFLGTEIVNELLHTTEASVYVLIRASDQHAAIDRLKALCWEEPALVQAIGSRIIPVCDDITLPGLGMSETDRDRISSTAYMIHAAADTGIQNTKDHLWRINVKGTQNALEVASGLLHLKRFVHVSTAYVAGQRHGIIS